MDAQLFRWVYDGLAGTFLGQGLGYWTHLGDTSVVVACAGLGLLEALLAKSFSDTSRGPRLWLPWVGVLLAGQLTRWLKVLVARPRPFEVLPLVGVMPHGAGESFPSGHTTLIFALATALSLRWPQRQLLWWLLAVGVAFSRVSLGLHWPSDLLGGALVGVGTVLGLAWIEKRIRSGLSLVKGG